MNERLVGAGAALGLALVPLGLGLLLVALSVREAAVLVVIGLVSAVVGPVVGWRYAQRPGTSDPSRAGSAILSMLILGLTVAAAYIAGMTLTSGFPGGPGNAVPFLIYALFESWLFVAIATLAVGVPLGVVWARLVRRVLRMHGVGAD